MEGLLRQLDAYIDSRIAAASSPPAGDVTQQLLQSQDFKNLVAAAARDAIDMEAVCESLSADISAEDVAEHIDASDVAQHVEVESGDIDICYSSLADYVDSQTLADYIDASQISVM